MSALITVHGEVSRERIEALGREWGIMAYDMTQQAGEFCTLRLTLCEHQDWESCEGGRKRRVRPITKPTSRTSDPPPTAWGRAVSVFRLVPSRLAWLGVGVLASLSWALPELARRGWPW